MTLVASGIGHVSMKRPKPEARGWRYVQRWRDPGIIIIEGAVYERGPLRVITTLEMAELPDGAGVGPQWHVSVSRAGKRPRPADVERVLRVFDLLGAEEDNHHPGIARHFWMPVDPAHRVDCECKVDEVMVVEPDGYRWSNARAESGCRGCEYERLIGQPCRLHGTEVTTDAARSRRDG